MRSREQTSSGSRPSLTVVFLLSVLLPGLGHLYIGRVGPAVRVFGALLLGILALLGLAFFATGPILAMVVRFAGLALVLAVAIDAVRQARRSGRHRWTAPRRATYAVMALVAGSVILYGLLAVTRSHVISLSRIPTNSMRPTLEAGDVVVVDRRSSATKDLFPGDVVVLESSRKPRIEYMKRIAGLPGQSVEVKDGCLVVDGEGLCRAHGTGPWETLEGRTYGIRTDEVLLARDFGPVIVPEDHVFLLGDNRPISADSREWGPVPVERIVGRMRHILWNGPTEGVLGGPVVHFERAGQTAFVDP